MVLDSILYLNNLTCLFLNYLIEERGICHGDNGAPFYVPQKQNGQWVFALAGIGSLSQSIATGLCGSSK